MEATPSFLFIAFFITIGSFILGGILAWNLKDIFDMWYENSGYAKHILHPEMYDEDGNLHREELMRVRFYEEEEYDEED